MQVFAAINKDDQVRCKSASGGAFPAIAKKVLSVGGIVVGAAYQDDLTVAHRLVREEVGLAQLQGVKYVFGSVARPIYEGIAQALADGKKVLFSGTPCQVAAMRKRFGANANLLLVDLVCFGAPGLTLWKKYIAWMEKKRGKKLVAINPRDKSKGWGRTTYYSYTWANGETTRQLSLFDPYAQAFYSTLGFRRCCFNCPFRGENHASDITLGDCWGAEDVGIGGEKAKKGVSLLICHSDTALAVLSDSGLELTAISAAIIAKHNQPYFTSPVMKPRYEEFSKDAVSMDFAQLIEKYGLQVSRMTWMKQSIKRVMRKVLGR